MYIPRWFSILGSDCQHSLKGAIITSVNICLCSRLPNWILHMMAMIVCWKRISLTIYTIYIKSSLSSTEKVRKINRRFQRVLYVRRENHWTKSSSDCFTGFRIHISWECIRNECIRIVCAVCVRCLIIKCIISLGLSKYKAFAVRYGCVPIECTCTVYLQSISMA